MTIDPRLLRVERWRTRLLEQGLEGIDAFVAEYPAADKRLLKSLVQQSLAIKHRGGTARKLLRYIRALDSAGG